MKITELLKMLLILGPYQGVSKVYPFVKTIYDLK